MNLVVSSGRLSQNPEEKSFGDGKLCVNFSIAMPRDYKNKDGKYDADFINYRAFGKTAEFISKYFKKGSRIEVVGKLRQNDYTDKDGVKHRSVVVDVNSASFGESKQSPAISQEVSKEKIDGFLNVPDGDTEEMPFN